MRVAVPVVAGAAAAAAAAAAGFVVQNPYKPVLQRRQ